MDVNDFNELGIGENFIISSDSGESQFLKAPAEDSKNKTKSDPFVFNIKF